MLKKRCEALILIVFMVLLSFAVCRGRQHKYDGWVLTQYADESGNQGVFYTFYNSESDIFLIIDGGWPQNAEQVRKVIKSHGNHVNGWFVSHFHTDHVGAFNEIISNPGNITIDNVYAPPIDYGYYIEKAREWDQAETYTRFLELMSGDSRLKYLNRGDIVSFDDLSIDILHSYENKMKEKNRKDIHNNASLILKANLEEDSVLFLSDCHSKWVSKSLLKRYSIDELDATYIQVGHHGTNSFPVKFYDSLNQPKAYLFDAPEWLMTSEEQTAKDLSKHFIEKGILVIDQQTAPNVIELH